MSLFNDLRSKMQSVEVIMNKIEEARIRRYDSTAMYLAGTIEYKSVKLPVVREESAIVALLNLHGSDGWYLSWLANDYLILVRNASSSHTIIQKEV